MPTPSLSGLHLTNLGGRIFLSDAGEPLWWGKFDDPVSSKNEGLFYGHKLLVRKGVTRDNLGRTIKTFGNQVRVRYMSRNGRYLLFSGQTGDPPFYDPETIYLLDLESSSVPHVLKR